MPSKNDPARADDEDQRGRGSEQADAVTLLDGCRHEDDRERAIGRGRAERVTAGEGVGRQLDERILELGASSLEDRLERLAEDLAARKGCDDEDCRSRQAVPNEEQAGEDHEGPKKYRASRVRDDSHHVDENVRNYPLHPVNDADVEPDCARPEEHRSRERCEGGGGEGKHYRIRTSRVVRHVRTIPAQTQSSAEKL